VVGYAPAVIGREDELSAVRAAVDSAVAGTAAGLLVSGEAGVGKTVLVRQATDDPERGAEVMWVSCLPLTSLAVPLLPLRSALRSSAEAPDFGTTDAVLAFDAWLDRTADRHPVVLVVDDVQWADQSSLDVLMYVLAGRPDRRLAVLLTMRSGEDSDGHGVRRWLADVRRLPRVTELILDRLDRLGTRDQLTVLLGRAPHESLVDEVHVRSRGNPYLTSLLTRGLSPDATALPADLPSELRDALSRTWYQLSPAARRLTAILAVAGTPERSAELAGVAMSVGFADPVVPMLREAVDAGVLRTDAGERYWFAHPLLAEVLVDVLLPEERRALHAGFAAAAPKDGTDIDGAIALADHHEQAGHVESAYRWALQAASLAEANGGPAEAVRLLRRALDLRFRVGDAAESRTDLLHWLRRCCARAGLEAEELSAIEELLALLDSGQEPLTVAPLLCRRMLLRFGTGREFAGVDGVREAERLTAPFPDSREHALATARLAYSLLWHTDNSGIPLADTAVRLAESGGSNEALATALIARSMARLLADDLGGANTDATRAWDIAARNRDPDLFSEAVYTVVNSIDAARYREHADVFHRGHIELEIMGSPHIHIAELCAWEAHGLLVIGDWQSCLAKLRVALGGRPGVLGDTRARLTAALLACRQGRQAEADAHMARAEELFAEQSGFLGLDFDAVRAELAVVAGDTERAVTVAMAGLSQEAPPLGAERLLPLAARALADRAVGARDRGEDASAAVAALDDLRRTYPEVVTEPLAQDRWFRRYLRAMQELADVETARGRVEHDESARWQRAAAVAREAGLAWDEAYSRWREAEAALRDRATRLDGITALREAHRLATDLHAVPVLTQVEALARSARIPLAAPTPVPKAAGDTASVPGLTGREREILAHLVAGRTYAEIAKALVLSEKTVSVHISNMLRKTGATNRVELAQLAYRLERGTR
jgi:DNA-binding CsgD family transcriptional regulator